MNAEPPGRDAETENVDPVVADPPLRCDPPTLDEVRKAVEQLKNEKALGVSGFHAEIFKAGGNYSQVVAQSQVFSIWSTGVISTD